MTLIADLGLSVRIATKLESSGLNTVDELMAMTPHALAEKSHISLRDAERIVQLVSACGPRRKTL